MTRKDYEQLSDAMGTVLQGMGEDNQQAASIYFIKLANELYKRNENMDLDRFLHAAGV